MAIIRQNNWLGNQRVDLPDLRAIESSVSNDFDNIIGDAFAGQQALIVRGFTLTTTSMVSQPATSLQLNVADSIVFHYNASEAGTMLEVPAGTAAETLNSLNSNVYGSFTASAYNYIGLDFIRTADDNTSDLTKFCDSSGATETSQIVPKARILNYKIIISSLPFSTANNICPIAIVLTDASNNIVTITDARQMMFRLGSGGSMPNYLNKYTWFDTTRKENYLAYDGSTYTNNPFLGGDKYIYSFKEWIDATMSSIWELKGGPYWYSPCLRDNVRICYDPADVIGTVNDNWDWNLGASHLSWKGLSVVFENSSTLLGVAVWSNEIQDGTNVDFPDGSVLYADIQRTTSGATIVPAVALISALSSPTIPGTRFILAWRKGNHVYARDRAYEIGRNWTVATVVADPDNPDLTGILGAVKLSTTPHDASNPTCPAIMANGQIEVTAFANNSYAIKGTGFGNGYGVEGVAGGTNGKGVSGTGSDMGAGVYGLGGSSGLGVWGNVTDAGIGVLATSGEHMLAAPSIVGMTTTTSAAAGVVDAGTHEYKITYVTLYGETIASSAKSYVAPGGKKCDIANIPLGDFDWRIFGRRIYRTIAGPGADFYLVAQLSDTSTSTYTDNTDDATLTSPLNIALLNPATDENYRGAVGVLGDAYSAPASAGGDDRGIGVIGIGFSDVALNGSGAGVLGVCKGSSGYGVGVEGRGGIVGTGVRAIGGESGGPGLIALGKSTYNGITSSSEAGYGAELSGNATAANLRLVPQSATPSSPQLGDLYVDSDDNKLYFYNGTSWKEVAFV